MLYLYTAPPTLGGVLKYLLKKVLKRTRGPDAVAGSLIRGLKSLGIPYQINSANKKEKSSVHVISGIDTLKWAIAEKEKSQIKYLSAGPNIVVLPNEEKELILNKNIDKIILPSAWTKELFFKFCPELKEKQVAIWPAGVAIPKKVNKNKELDFLILDKRKDKALLENIITALKANSKNFQIIEYGKFSQKKYHELLNKTKCLIYLGRTESQGLALFEAWAYDVPTMVYEENTFKYKNITWVGASAAPYLDEPCGFFFNEDFKTVLESLAKKKFSTREYCTKHYADEITTKKFLELTKL